MIYIGIGLVVVNVILATRYFILHRAIHIIIKQMEEIKDNPKRNRQLKLPIPNRALEQLLKSINDIYQERQQERITYQRRETQIRCEIENISHDLRTPLTSIIGYIDLIQDIETKETEREEFLQIINKRAKILQGLIYDFYELSRIEGDDYPLLLDAVHVQNILRETVVAYYNEFEKKGIQVEVTLENNPCFIISDKIQFNRIINNLIQNALKYSSTIFILTQYTKGTECILQFQNDSRQIKESDLDYIFDRFYIGDRSRNNQSTGLGLTISKILVEKMKGSITAGLDGNMFSIELRWKVF
jgi:signal transduction histidine kinase